MLLGQSMHWLVADRITEESISTPSSYLETSCWHQTSPRCGGRTPFAYRRYEMPCRRSPIEQWASHKKFPGAGRCDVQSLSVDFSLAGAELKVNSAAMAEHRIATGK